MPAPKTKPEADRARYRQIVSECGALVDLLNELYPPTALPSPQSTDREVSAWLAERRLVARLQTLREEARRGTDGLPKVTRR